MSNRCERVTNKESETGMKAQLVFLLIVHPCSSRTKMHRSNVPIQEELHRREAPRRLGS
jgi:hypothetical protein